MSLLIVLLVFWSFFSFKEALTTSRRKAKVALDVSDVVL